MKITYDKKIDAMYIKLRDGHYDHSKKISDDILVDVSKKGEVLGVEILDAKENIGTINPERLNVEVSVANS